LDAILNSSLFNYLTVALGLGFVIFIHELGHFLIAKLNGVKVEAFAIGFGRPLLAYRKGLGLRTRSTLPEYERWLAAHPEAAEVPPSQQAVSETEYSIRAIPLGGFVKMLGEGDEADHEAARTTDPRAYPNKSVGARMAIISAGVIMNAVFGLLCYAWAYHHGGLSVVPARVGGVVAGHPAYDAGLQAGDIIESADGQTDLDFGSLKVRTAMSASDQTLQLAVRRPGVEAPLAMDVKPVRQPGAEMKTMGIHMPPSLELSPIRPILTPAGMTFSNPSIDQAARLGRKIVAAGPEGEAPQPMADAFELARRLDEWRDRPVVVQTAPIDDARIPAAARSEAPAPASLAFTLPPAHVVDFGFRMQMGPIVAIQPGSPAEAAGLRAGDRIVGVDGIDPLDPLRLPDQLAHDAGRPVSLRVARSEGGKPEQILTLTALPRPISAWSQPSQFLQVYASVDPEEPAPLDVPALGLAYRIPPRIAAVTPGSPAARAGIESGDILDKVTLTIPPPSAQSKAAPTVKTFTLDLESGSWPALFAAIQSLPRHEVGIQTSRARQPAMLTPEPVEGWYFPARGLSLLIDTVPLPPLPPGAAFRRGFDETRGKISEIYAMLRSLFSGNISIKAVAGPLGIVSVASDSARAGFVVFLQFLAFLSINLAVINFLPIPPLDGGQMAFLIAEKLRGKPLPEAVFNAGTIAGLVFVLGLMAFVLFQDFMKLFLG
jgi:regulator of sigma E protease